MYDLIIRNGTVIDGTGADRKVADIAISNGRIMKVGEVLERATMKSMPKASWLRLAGWIFTLTMMDRPLGILFSHLPAGTASRPW